MCTLLTVPHISYLISNKYCTYVLIKQNGWQIRTQSKKLRISFLQKHRGNTKEFGSHHFKGDPKGLRTPSPKIFLSPFTYRKRGFNPLKFFSGRGWRPHGVPLKMVRTQFFRITNIDAAKLLIHELNSKAPWFDRFNGYVYIVHVS